MTTPEELQAIAQELAQKYAKGIKTEADLNQLSMMLQKITVEAALNAELDEHLGYEKHAASKQGNSRNGRSRKTLRTATGQFELETPRDRDGSFEPQLVKKQQTRFTSMDDKILFLYAQGMSTREITSTFKEMYNADISPQLISRVTEAVIDQVNLWQQRPLEAVYPILYLDCLVVKIRQDKRVINKAVYLALGVNMEGRKELLGMWIAENEGSKFWLSVLTELQNRGLKDVLIACVDGLKGFPEAIHAVYPQTRVQLCIVHMVRNSMKYVSWKNYKAVAKDLKAIYQSATEDEALNELAAFTKTWGDQYPLISESWTAHWDHINVLFDYPEDIRKAIYTTNAIESLNSVVRKAIRKRKVFPTDDAARKVVYLSIMNASKKWTMPIRNWRNALNRFMIEFKERLVEYL